MKIFRKLLGKFIRESIGYESSDLDLLDLHGRYGKTLIKMINFMVKINPYEVCSTTNLDVVDETSTRDYVHHRRYFRIYNLFSMSIIRGDATYPKRVYIISLMLTYLAIKLSIMAIAQILYQHHFNLWIDKLPQSLGPCAPKSLIATINRDEQERVVIMARWLNYLGSAGVSGTEINLYCILLSTILVVVLYGLAYLARSGPIIHLNAQTFFYYPLIERGRIDNERDCIVESMMNCYRREAENCGDMNGKNNSIYPEDLTSLESYEIVCSCKLQRYYESRNSFMKLYQEHNFASFVKPRYLTAYAYAKQIRNQTITHIFCYILTAFFGLAAFLTLIYLEIIARANQRYEILKCNQINPDSTYVRESYILEPLSKKSHIEAYSKYLNSTQPDISHLAWTVELPVMYMSNFSQFTIEITTMFIVLGYGATFHVLTVFDGRTSILIWIKQIQKQLEASVDLLYEYRLMNLRNEDKKDLKEAAKELEGALVITLINFMIFVREQKSFQNYLWYCSNTISSFLVATFGLTYGLGVQLGKNNLPYLLLVIVLIMILFNVMCFISGSLLQNIQRMYSAINDLVANAAMNKMEISYVITLWRRQILTKDEVDKFYGVRVIGIKLDYSNLIQFNSYALASMTYLYRYKR